MKIKKVFNNNVVSSENDLGEEIVVMGRGLAFQKKMGDEIDEDYVEKIFSIKNDSFGNQIQSLFHDIPAEEVEASKEIIQFIEKELAVELNSSIYLTLTDHLHYALERYREGLTVPNPLVLEIKRFYPKQYEVSLRVVRRLNQYFDIHLDENEAGFITFHIVNAQQDDMDMHTTMENTRMVRDVLTIISSHFGIEFNEDSINYMRIITHLQYFFQRLSTSATFEEDDDFMYEIVKEKYPKACKCTDKINLYLQKKGKLQVSKSEYVYLTLHIQRVAQEALKNE